MELVRSIEGFLGEEDGVTAIEYALIASLIALIAITGMGLLGNQLNLMFQHIKNQLAIS
ncbi:Flp family type IVb pilin [Azohydromonas australica]|uniref:Flp family type IVb pilin n=1 Tax=Azohydromonas australica TaxID=364039 RepID=UPI00040E5B80|nr:Flp family type IVb pilin [Azohydromonas australica]